MVPTDDPSQQTARATTLKIRNWLTSGRILRYGLRPVVIKVRTAIGLRRG